MSRWSTGSLRAAVTAVVLALVLSACGSHHRAAIRVTSGKYGDYGAQTITVPAGPTSSKLCKADANGFAGQADSFVSHYGSTAASSTDVYYLGMRQELGDFDARRCDPGLLRAALVHQLTARQLRRLTAELPHSMAEPVRAALEGG
ncbi:MAG TPA: hypothetical protein VFU30_03895 [Gaiellaceae bacterium]|nr:hypothetical protein [Gaiellaceae bacterium]